MKLLENLGAKTQMIYQKLLAFLTACLLTLILSIANAHQVLAEPPLTKPFNPNSLIALAESQITFDFPEPTDAQSKKLTLWSTFYFVHQAKVSNATDAITLKDSNGNSLGIKLSQKDWCTAALEGTVQVSIDSNTSKTFNFAKQGTTAHAKCKSFFPSLKDSVIQAMNRSLFAVAKGHYGDGSGGFILVPYRTIAVDKTVIPLGTLIYIPSVRGKEVILPSGTKIKHDGYFFAADVGGAIKQNHIDTFLGITRKNPFPHVKSDKTKTFEAFTINDSKIKDALKALHKP